MANSIFGTSSTPLALSLGKHILTIGDSIDSNSSYKLAVNRLRYSFARTISPYFPLNSDTVGKILVSGEPVGSLELSYLMGIGTNVAKFIKEFSDVCKMSDHNISLNVGVDQDCGNDKDTTGYEATKITFRGCLITAIGGEISRSERGNLCVGSVSLSFTDLDFGE